jgi:hypothetical protein
VAQDPEEYELPEARLQGKALEGRGKKEAE